MSTTREAADKHNLDNEFFFTTSSTTTSTSYNELQREGLFYPEYDVPVILLLCTIIVCGIGNWLVCWCFVRTQELNKNPFNMLVVSFSVTNGLATNMVAPLELVRVAMLYRPISASFCRAKIVLKTFCFGSSLLTIFITALLRMLMGLRLMPLKLSRARWGLIVTGIVSLAALSAPVLLQNNSATYINCMGQVDISRIHRILGMRGSYVFAWDPLLKIQTEAAADKMMDTYIAGNVSKRNNPPEAGKKASVNSTHDQSAIWGDAGKTSEDRMAGAGVRGTGTSRSPTALWQYYFLGTILLIVGTVVSYVALVIALRRHQASLPNTMLGNKMDILTLKVMAYVTAAFFISFCVPFLPALVHFPPAGAPEVLHYTAIFHTLSGIDGALAPLIYYSFNSPFRTALTNLLNRCQHRAQQIHPLPPPFHHPQPTQPLEEGRNPRLFPPEMVQNNRLPVLARAEGNESPSGLGKGQKWLNRPGQRGRGEAGGKCVKTSRNYETDSNNPMKSERLSALPFVPRPANAMF